MLPDIRAVIAAIAAAIGLLMISFGLVAAFRVAQDSRAASLQADLAQRGRASPPEHRPIGIIETPGPTVAVTARVAPDPPLSTEPDPAAAAPAPDSLSVAAAEPAPENKEPAPVMAAAPAETEAPALPAPPLAVGGPSPEEVAQAEAEHLAAERAKIKKAAAEKAKKARAARIARERKAVARRAAQARAKQQGNAFNSAGAFNNAPFGDSFGSFESNTRRP